MNKVRVSESTITALQKLITGNEDEGGLPLGPYRSGPALVSFFNQFGFHDEYGTGFPSRWNYTKDKLIKLNGGSQMKSVIEYAVDPRHFIETNYDIYQAIFYLNQFLEFDGFMLKLSGKRYTLRKVGSDTLFFDRAFTGINKANIDFINEQIDKCNSKLDLGDYDGAITNARSFLEAVLLEIERKVTGRESTYDGDLPKLFKRVQKLLNLEPDHKDLSDDLKQALRGLVNIISGLAPLRNKMSDAHARVYKPSSHHAKLVINCVYTIATFILESLEYQVERGLLDIKIMDNSTSIDS